MPEGREIRRAADEVERAIAGHVIKHVELPHPILAGQEDIFLGYKVLGIKTHGKAMLTRLSSYWTVYSHNQLCGRWTVDFENKAPHSNRSLRLAITAGDHTARL